jgi:hypothetical protein
VRGTEAVRRGAVLVAEDQGYRIGHEFLAV